MTKPALKYVVAFLLNIAVFSAANADSLENMERERAILVYSFISPDLDDQQRSERIEISRNRLIDLERLFLRDKSLHAKNSAHIRAAFENYDLTFLVHAAAETDLLLTDHWLDQLGISTQSLMTTQLGPR